MPGILLATETGFHLHVGCENARLLDMLWDQLEGLTHPTWNELTQFLRLPRSLEAVEKAAEDIVRSHGEQRARAQELAELLKTCAVF
jgi:hypothetical protein